MTFSINKDVFQKEITKALKFTSSQLSSLPSLSGVCLEVKNNKLTISSTNLNDFYTSVVDVKSASEFRIVFDAKKANELLGVMSAGELAVEVKESGIIFSVGTIQGEFGLYPTDGYPEFPIVKDEKEIVLDEGTINHLPMVIFSASKDDSRPVLTGILIELSDAGLQMVSTDGFRLSIFNKEIGAKGDGWSFIASSRFISELLSLNQGKDLRLKYSEEGKVFSCQMDNVTLVSRTIDGDFPPYQKVIPTKATTKIVMDAVEFAKNIKAVSIFAREQANILILDISKERVVIKPKGQKGESSFATQTGISFDGADIKVAFNYRYILDFLVSSGASQVSIELTTSLSPVGFREVGFDGYVHVIMPLRTEEIE